MCITFPKFTDNIIRYNRIRPKNYGSSADCRISTLRIDRQYHDSFPRSCDWEYWVVPIVMIFFCQRRCSCRYSSSIFKVSNIYIYTYTILTQTDFTDAESTVLYRDGSGYMKKLICDCQNWYPVTYADFDSLNMSTLYSDRGVWVLRFKVYRVGIDLNDFYHKRSLWLNL